MRLKIPILICVVLIFHLTLHAEFFINDVECLAGEDFVQLHFKSNQIIPIPDIFYPQKDNYKFIVMRINNIDFNFQKRRLTFDSSIIEKVNIIENKDYVDVEITLKEKVNYRVFTNRNGVYIEFPTVKNIQSSSRTTGSIGIPDDKPALKKSEPSESVTKSDRKAFEFSTPGPATGRSIISHFKVAEKNQEGIKFHFFLSNNTDYRVIPIPEAPVRLAIDLLNTKSRRIKEFVNYLNVKTLRGAYNKPGVFRLVFDLDYLKNYRVNFNKNILEVSFFEKAEARKNINASLKLPEKKPETDKPVPISTSPEVIKMEKKPGPIKNVEPVKDEPIHFQKDKTLEQKQTNEVTGLKSQTVNPVRTAGEFFSPEKSKVANDDFSQNYLNSEDNQDDTGDTSIIKKTITEGKRDYQGEPMDFNFKDADLNNVLLFFAKISGLNFLIDPNVSGKITASMTQVPWDQALEYFLRVNKLDMIQEGNIIRIGKVDVLAKEATERRRLREAREMEGRLDVFTVPLSYAKVDDIRPILQKYLSQRGDIVVDKRTNQLIITDIPRNRPVIDKLIDTLDLPTRQVAIEARIVETEINYTKNFGIQWGFNFIADSAYGNQTSLSFPNSIGISGSGISDPNAPGLVGPLGGYAINLPAPTFNSGTVFSFGNVANTFRLDAAITAMQKDGKGKVISAPKATTQDNQEAVIQQGRQIPVQTIQNNTVTTRYVPAALELRVTPQITAEGTIITKIFITNNS
ncbi:MAG: AMIN domain-containing protein, partial [Candidatus Aminicenantes bacterium]|nr:AMIN domain-containing protein [Candidatus Aminicenantes bacterium]